MAAKKAKEPAPAKKPAKAAAKTAARRPAKATAPKSTKKPAKVADKLDLTIPDFLRADPAPSIEERVAAMRERQEREAKARKAGGTNRDWVMPPPPEKPSTARQADEKQLRDDEVLEQVRDGKNTMQKLQPLFNFDPDRKVNRRRIRQSLKRLVKRRKVQKDGRQYFPVK